MRKHKNNTISNFVHTFDSKKLTNFVIFTVGLTTAIAVGLFTFYIVTFKGGLSHNQSNWGVFGDFFGGVLNPVFGFFTLIVVLLTFTLQNRQLEMNKTELETTRQELRNTKEIAALQVEHLKTQFKANDLYKMIKLVYQEFLCKIDESPHKKLEFEKIGKSTGGTFRRHLNLDFEEKILLFNHHTTNIELYRPLNLLLLELSNYLNEYHTLTNEDTIPYYYKRRLEYIVRAMLNYGLIEKTLADKLKVPLT